MLKFGFVRDCKEACKEARSFIDVVLVVIFMEAQRSEVWTKQFLAVRPLTTSHRACISLGTVFVSRIAFMSFCLTREAKTSIASYATNC